MLAANFCTRFTQVSPLNGPTGLICTEATFAGDHARAFCRISLAETSVPLVPCQISWSLQEKYWVLSISKIFKKWMDLLPGLMQAPEGEQATHLCSVEWYLRNVKSSHKTLQSTSSDEPCRQFSCAASGYSWSFPSQCQSLWLSP